MSAPNVTRQVVLVLILVIGIINSCAALGHGVVLAAKGGKEGAPAQIGVANESNDVDIFLFRIQVLDSQRLPLIVSEVDFMRPGVPLADFQDASAVLIGKHVVIAASGEPGCSIVLAAFNWYCNYGDVAPKNPRRSIASIDGVTWGRSPIFQRNRAPSPSTLHVL
jgi:hypothetical protein